MKHFILPFSPDPEGIIRLYEKDFHYLARVRRLKPGDSFNAIIPGGEKTLVRVLSISGNVLTGECTTLRLCTTPRFCTTKQDSTLPPIALFQGMPKGTKMDLIVRQAAEGAVSLIVPFESEYSLVKLDKELNKEKVKRWERIVKEARQQSGGDIETRLNPPCSFNGMLELWESLKKEYPRPLGIFLHQEALDKGTFHDYLGICPGIVALAVGPEGGFSPKELKEFSMAGFKPIYMGDSVLRTETAALYGTAAVKIILLESKAWISGLPE